MTPLPPAVCIVGPTASGKTRLAVEVARQFPAHVISVDSAQVYRGMDIGTAKPTAAEQAQTPHALLDIVDPASCYSAGQFRRDALREMTLATGNGRLPVLAGGTMLYFRALWRGLNALPERDAELRSKIDERAREVGWTALHAELAERDPQAASRIHPNDSQRIQRALEVLELGGQPLSDQQSGETAPAAFQFLKLAVAPASREVLHGRIARRFREMMAAGLLEEVRALRDRGDLTARSPSMRAVGYRQLWRYLDGEIDLEQAVADAITATRRLAKRQMTWLRSEPELTWLDPEDPEFVVTGIRHIQRFLVG